MKGQRFDSVWDAIEDSPIDEPILLQYKLIRPKLPALIEMRRYRLALGKDRY